MRFFTDACEQLAAVGELRQCIRKQISPVSLTGAAQLHKAQILLTLSQETPMLAILPDDASARRLCEDINYMAGERLAYPYPAKELNFLEAAGMSREYEQLRISALTALCAGECRVLAASAEAVTQYTLPRAVLLAHTLTLKQGGMFAPDALTEALAANGYVRCEQVDAPGQYAVRGNILDIYSPQNLLPVRMEFWGDDIDTMAWFEPDTQRRTDALDTVQIAPAVEALPDAAALAAKMPQN